MLVHWKESIVELRLIEEKDLEEGKNFGCSLWLDLIMRFIECCY